MEENIKFLQDQLRRSSVEFSELVSSLSPEVFVQNTGGKWSAGQDLHHLVKTLGVIFTGFRLPMWLARLVFSRADRPSKTYAEFGERYRIKMKVAHKAPSFVLPKPVSAEKREKLLRDLATVTDGFCARLSVLHESDLDKIAAPHPLFGKVTLREMVMSAWLHTDHHTNMLKRKLGRE